MTQNREPPAYQEYPAQMMAKFEYREMSLTGRGLLYTLRLECWVNRRVPSDPTRLARVLGLAQSEIAIALREVAPFFVETEGHLSSRELEDYRLHLEATRERQREGGRKGAEMTNGALSGKPPGKPPGKPSGDPQVTRRGSRGSTPGSSVQSKPTQSKPTQHHGGAFGSGLTAEDYRRATRGE